MIEKADNSEGSEFLLDVDRELHPETGELNVQFLLARSVQLGEEAPHEIRRLVQFTLLK